MDSKRTSINHTGTGGRNNKDAVSANVLGNGETYNSIESGHSDGNVKRAPDGKVTTRESDCVGPCSYGSRGVEVDTHTTPPDSDVHDCPRTSKEESVPSEDLEKKDKEKSEEKEKVDYKKDKKKDLKKEDDKKEAKLSAPDSENSCDCATCSIANLL